MNHANERQVVHQSTADPYATDTDVVAQRTVSTRWGTPLRPVTFALGAVITLIGAIVTARTGIDSDLTTPVTKVLGTTQSAIPGLLGLVGGLLMMMGAAVDGEREALGLVGLTFALAGIIGLATSNATKMDIGFDNAAAWYFIVVGFLAIVLASVHGRWVHRSVAVTDGY